MHPHNDCGPRGLHFMSFNRRGGGFPPFGGFGRGGFGGGENGGGFGRLFRDGGLRLITLSLIADGPRHGYDIIKAFEERSSGMYSPSPGVVYPTLTYLEEAGYATSAADGNKKVYTITDAGRAYLAENRESVDTMLGLMERLRDKLSKARDWFDWSEDRPGRHAGPEPQETGPAADLERARRRLRGLIAAATEGSEADQQRVAEILQRAADEILGRNTPPA